MLTVMLVYRVGAGRGRGKRGSRGGSGRASHCRARGGRAARGQGDCGGNQGEQGRGVSPGLSVPRQRSAAQLFQFPWRPACVLHSQLVSPNLEIAVSTLPERRRPPARRRALSHSRKAMRENCYRASRGQRLWNPYPSQKVASGSRNIERNSEWRLRKKEPWSSGCRPSTYPK